MKGLYRFYWDCGRMGDLEGLFVAEIDQVIDSFGKLLYFGEVLGKHSEISGPFSQEDVELITIDQEFIEKFLVLDLETGLNPLNFIQEEQDD